MVQLRPNPTLAGTRRGLAAISLSVLLPLGLLWRLAPLHLPPFALKYGGSALWAAAVYWVVVAFLPRWPTTRVTVIALLTATAVECLKRLYWPPLDHFRGTMAGKLLLGRYFTIGAIFAYWLAIAAAALIDTRLRSKTKHSASPHSPFEGTM